MIENDIVAVKDGEISGFADSDAGKLLMANEDLLRRLQEELYIQRRPIFGAGDNYDEMMDAFTRSSEERAIALNNRNYIENTENDNE